MDVADIRFLFAYDRWATEKILAVAATVPGEEWTEIESHRSPGSRRDPRPCPRRPRALAVGVAGAAPPRPARDGSAA